MWEYHFKSLCALTGNMFFVISPEYGTSTNQRLVIRRHGSKREKLTYRVMSLYCCTGDRSRAAWVVWWDKMAHCKTERAACRRCWEWWMRSRKTKQSQILKTDNPVKFPCISMTVPVTVSSKINATKVYTRWLRFESQHTEYEVNCLKNKATSRHQISSDTSVIVALNLRQHELFLMSNLSMSKNNKLCYKYNPRRPSRASVTVCMLFLLHIQCLLPKRILKVPHSTNLKF